MKKGFTLLELLVVIAIIGILASVIIMSLSSARDKGNIAAIQSGMKQLLNEFYIENSGSLPVGSGGNWNGAPCPLPASAPNGSIFQASPTLLNLIAAVEKNTYQNKAYCHDNITVPGRWFMIAFYPPDGSKVWCIDSSGFSGEIASPSFPTANSLCQ